MDYTGYTIAMVAKMYGEKNPKYVRALVHDGKVPGYKHKGCWYIKQQDLDKAKYHIMNKKRSLTRWC